MKPNSLVATALASEIHALIDEDDTEALTGFLLQKPRGLVWRALKTAFDTPSGETLCMSGIKSVEMVGRLTAFFPNGKIPSPFNAQDSKGNTIMHKVDSADVAARLALLSPSLPGIRNLAGQLPGETVTDPASQNVLHKAAEVLARKEARQIDLANLRQHLKGSAFGDMSSGFAL